MSDPRPTVSDPPPSLVRDPWAWACVLALVPLVLKSLGAALGEPAADDWDFVTYALFHPFSFFDGGGSSAFWRPLSHQTYYALVSPMLPAHALVVPIVNGATLLLITLLLHRLLRTRLPGAWAAAAATFPLVAESARMALQWPGLMVELAFIFFTVLALHEAVFGRLPTALLALLASLLSKEVAVVTALALPWLPRFGPTTAAPRAPPTPRAGRRAATRRRSTWRGPSRERWRWIVATAVTTLAWAIVYLLVRRAHDLHLPHGFETERATVGVPWPARYAWTVANTVRAALSLPVAHVGREAAAWVALLALLGVAGWIYRSEREARRRLAALAPVAIAGLLWFTLTLAPLIVVYPMWMPHRGMIASIGLGLALTMFLGAARPALIAALLVVRLALLVASPGPPARVALAPEKSGAFLDFGKLARLQLLMRETRGALVARFPTLPHGARVVLLHPPLLAEYAFGGSQALQVWYRDTTLRWSRYDDLRLHPAWTPTAILDFEPDERPQIRIVDPRAMHHYLNAEALVASEDWVTCMRELARADSLQPDSGARAFRSRVAGRRAFTLLGLKRPDAAEREADRSLELWSDCSDARYTLASAFAYTGRHREAGLQLDTLLSLYPNDRSAHILRDTLAAWEGRRR